MKSRNPERSGNHPVVRPRNVWGGLLVALVGAGVVGLGVAALSWTIAGVGAVVLSTGCVLALRGGVLNDAVAALSLTKEIRDVRAGREHGGATAGQMVEGHHGPSDVEEAGDRTRALLEASHASRPPGLAPVAGWLLVLVTLVAVSSQWDWVARTSTGRAASFRDTVLLITMAIGGLRIGIARGPHPIAVAIAGVAGLALSLGGLFEAHDRPAAAAIELACGCFGILAAVTAGVSPWCEEWGREDGDVRSGLRHTRP